MEKHDFTIKIEYLPGNKYIRANISNDNTGETTTEIIENMLNLIKLKNKTKIISESHFNEKVPYIQFSEKSGNITSMNMEIKFTLERG